jgi:hypothetical protein
LFCEGGHTGKSRRSAAALAAHQHGFGLVHRVMAEQQMQDALFGALSG